MAEERELKRAAAASVQRGTIRVDGHLSEPEWSAASAVIDFVQKEPVEGAAPSVQTDVRFLYDESALYVGARMISRPGGAIQAPLGRRDRGEQAEHLLVALDTFLDRRTAYVFGVTAAGVRIDRYHPRDEEDTYDEGYDPVWEAKTSIDDLGWTAELRIPFSQLRFSDTEDHVFGLNLHRHIPTLNEDDYWVPIPRTMVGWSSRFGELAGISGVSQTRRVEALPYIASASTVATTRGSNNPFDNGHNLTGRAGADLKIGIGPNLTLDATFNPDFGQVEADPAVVNLSAFESFFTEKRPFFLEGAELLNLPSVANFFYSRRIGATPIAPAVGDFTDYPQASTILGAGKLTGRLPSGTSIGLLAGAMGAEEARVFNVATPQIVRTPVAPRTNFAVARVQQEFGKEKSTVSGMVTALNRDLSGSDFLAKLLVRNAVAVAGDSTLRFRSGEYQITSYVGSTFIDGHADAVARVQRASAHFMQRPDRHYSKYDPTRTSMQGYKAGAIVKRTGGRHWIWSVTNDYESPGFEPNDLGRLNSGDGIQLIGDLRYRETVPSKVLRSYWIGATQTNEWTYGGELQNNTAQIYANQVWKNFWTTVASYTVTSPTKDARLTRGGPLMEVPRGWTADIQLRNRASAQTEWSGQLILGGVAGGGITRQFIGHLTFRPSPQWQVSLDPNLLMREVAPQQYVDTLDGGRPETFGKRYIFSSVDRTTYALQFRIGYTPKPDLNVDVYAEPFAASGRFSNFGELATPSTSDRRIYGTDGTTATLLPDGRLAVTDDTAAFTIRNNDFNVHSFRSNVVVRWEYRPGSALYVVWQQNRNLSETDRERISLIDPFRSLSAPGTHSFIVKTSFWIPIK